METAIFKIIYLIGYITAFLIRFPYVKKSKEAKALSADNPVSDKTFLFLSFLGMNLIPLIYVFTPFFNFVNYVLPLWLGVIGIFVYSFSIWLFYLSHRDLGSNWSVNVQIREGHKLIVEGIYKHIKHPMYASIWLMVVGQALILQNYIAGLSGLAAFGPLYFLRVFREEKLMVATFGDEYLEYSERTGRIFPNEFFRQLVGKWRGK